MTPSAIRTFENQTLTWGRHMAGRVLRDLVFRKCVFEGGGIVCDDPNHRVIIRNVELDRCEAYGGGLHGVILEDICVKGPSHLRMPDVMACALKHVKVTGRIDSLWFHDLWKLDPDDPINAEFKQANARYYEQVDWALDISEAEFSGECDIRGVPWQLIRRDPETQAIVTPERAQAMSFELSRIDLSKTYWRTSIESMLIERQPGAVLVVPKGSKKFHDHLKGLHLLRQAGIAEAD